MEWYFTLLLIFSGLMVLMATGLPVVFCFMLVNIVGAFLLWGGVGGLEQLSLSIFSSITNFIMMPLPLFILMGELMFRSGVAPLMMDALDKLLRRVAARLSLLAVAGGTLLAALTSTSMASVAVLGDTLVPEMERRGYRKPMSIGPILGSGGLANMIPPSGLAVLLGALARVSIGRILIGIILPGILMAALYATYIIGRCRLQPHIAPSYEIPPVPLLEKLIATVKYILPVGFIVFLVTGIIILGVATPSEAAAAGTVGCFLLAAAYKKLNWRVVKQSFTSSLQIISMLLILMTGAIAFSQILAMSGASRGLVLFALSLSLPPILILIAMQFILLLLGCFISPNAMIMITIPMFMPVVHAVGFDPVWFAVIYMINAEMSVTTPPFGVALFVMRGVAPPDTTMGDIYRAGLPFLGCDLIAMALIIAFPAIALWLPSLMQ